MSKNTTEDIVLEVKEEISPPELSHNDTTPPEPPIPPEDDDDDEDEDDDFDEEMRFELELTKEHNRKKYRVDRLRLEGFQAKTERIEVLQRLLESSFTNRFMYNPKLALLTDNELNLSPSVKQAKERYQITLYNEISKVIQSELNFEEDNNGKTD